MWFLTGIWHGADWTFVLWGLGYFLILLFEKLTGLDQKGNLFTRITTLLLVMFLWVLFRADGVGNAARYFGWMFGGGNRKLWDASALAYLDNTKTVLAAAVLCATPLPRLVYTRLPMSEMTKNSIKGAAGGENRQGGAAGAWASFDQKRKGTVGNYEQLMEYYCTDGLRNQSEIAELAAGYDNLIGWGLVMGDDGALMVNENGFLGSIRAERIETGENAESVADLNELVLSEGGLFCYVQIPGNVCKYEEDAVGTYADHANENADRLLEQLVQEKLSADTDLQSKCG